jgi:acetyl esterase/lipase
MSVCPNLAYGPVSANEVGSTQRLDLYKPVGPGPFPVIVWVHGGSWTGGDRHMFSINDDWSGMFRQVTRGYAVAMVDYRLADVATSFPTQIYDVKQAIRWLKWKASDYGLSTTKFAVGGHSAGANLATMAAATTAQNRFEPTNFGSGFGALANYSSATKLAIGYAGVYDFRQSLDINSTYGPLVTDGASFFLHCDLPGGTAGLWLPACTPAQLLDDSPIGHLSGPPVFLAHGDDDPVVSVAQARGFKATRDAAGQPTGLAIVPGGAHCCIANVWNPGLNPSLDLVLDGYVKNG